MLNTLYPFLSAGLLWQKNTLPAKCNLTFLELFYSRLKNQSAVFSFTHLVSHEQHMGNKHGRNKNSQEHNVIAY